jgi:hypothetical protein
MQDTELFETILGITTPWHVARVELKTEDKRVDLRLEHEATRWSCSECSDVLPGVLRFVTHPITNGIAEGLNGKIMSIKRKAGGFRNPANQTTAIYFHCGGLDLYPR